VVALLIGGVSVDLKTFISQNELAKGVAARITASNVCGVPIILVCLLAFA
jgi:hypothetical protein